MRKTLYQLAYQNLKKYKKHYIIVTLFIFILSFSFMTYLLTWENHYELEKLYHQKTYGTWYLWTSLDDVSLHDIEEKINNQSFYVEHGYCYDQGMDAYTHRVAYFEESLFEMCQLKLQSGRFPKSEDEIMISSSLKNQSYELNQVISLTLEEKTEDYTIVGIIENSQNIFPDIYTNKKCGQLQMIANSVVGEECSDGVYEISRTQLSEDSWMSQTITAIHHNKYGYDASPNVSHLVYSQQLLLIFVEGLVLVLFVINALTSSSLKKRNKEFALLRGIGMTSRQLFAMVFYENLWTSLLAIGLGFILAIIVTFFMMLYYQTVYHLFTFCIPLSYIGYLCMLLMIVLVFTVYPIHSSTNQALSGAFGGRTFQYIQVRYRRLKKQTKLRLAYRELISYKKITFSLFFLVCLLCLACTTFFINEKLNKYAGSFESFHYVDCYLNENTVQYSLDELQSFHEGTSYLYRDVFSKGIYENQSFSHFQITEIPDINILDHCLIEGRIPQNNHEVLISEEARFEQRKDNEISTIKDLEINDKFRLGKDEYQVVGMIKINEMKTLDDHSEYRLYYMPHSSLYMMSDEFEKYTEGNYYENGDGGIGYHMIEVSYTLRYYTDSLEQSKELAAQINERFPMLQLNCSDQSLNERVGSHLFSINIRLELLYIPILVLLVFCYFINKSYMMNNYKDYALLRLIGMTKKDLIMKQVYKAFIMSGFIFCIEVLWLLLVNYNYQMITIPYNYLFISLSVVFIFYMIVYCVPLFTLMKEDLMSDFYQNE